MTLSKTASMHNHR